MKKSGRCDWLAPGATMASARCSVRTLAGLGSAVSARRPRLLARDSRVLVARGEREVLVFGRQESALLSVEAVLQFDSAVTLLLPAAGRHQFYVLCENAGIHRVTLPPGPSPDPVLLPVPPEAAVLRDEGICCFVVVEEAVAEETLATLSLRGASWVLSLYKRAEKLFESSVLVVPPQGDRAELGSPVMCVVHPSDGAAPGRTDPPGHLYLEPVLYRLLFGVDAALLRCPAVLCGLPDGRLLCLPLCGLRSSEQKVRPSVLHSLEQPLVLLGTSGGPQGLVAVGQQGRVLLVTTRDSDSEGKVEDFRELDVRGPVACACLDGSRLYYSTAADLVTLQLTPGQVPVSLNVSRVTALSLTWNPAEGGAVVELLALSLTGQLQKVTLPQGSEARSSARLPSTLAGQRVKDLLAAIGDVWVRASSLKSSVKDRKEVLRLLNQVLNVSSLLLSPRKAGEAARPITCHGVTSWSSVLQEDALMLRCTLENHSPHVLEPGWSLSVQVQSVSRSAAVTHSFVLQKLEPGRRTGVDVPLGTACDLTLPLQVHTSLMFSMGAVWGSSEENPQLSCVGLPLNTLVVDWLDGLRLDRPSSPAGSSDFLVQRFLRSRGVTSGERGQEPGPGSYRAALKVSRELLASRLKGPGRGGLGAAVLTWLLGQPVPARVSAHCPSGHCVQLAANEVAPSDCSQDAVMAAVELQVESSSMAAVCGLHHAILRRVQDLLSGVSVEREASAAPRAESLRRVLRRVEALGDALQQARVPVALGGGTRTSSERLLQVYQQLREEPLLVM
uniref:Fanconi anemia core complex-associated protein 100 n=2 Tax=Denticeps clupeoides TaxID=299321 RepID=A0AAY4CNW3_9TELE